MKPFKRICGKIVAMDTLGARTITIKEHKKLTPTVYPVDDTILSIKSFTTVKKGEKNTDNKHVEIGDSVDILLFDHISDGVSVSKSLYRDSPPPENMRDDGEFYTLDFNDRKE